MNKVFLNGYLAADPKQRITAKGLEQSNIIVAVNDIKNPSDSYFIPCVVWGTTAKYVNSNLKKGNFVAIDGRLTRRSYLSTDGKTNYITEVIIDNLKNFGSRRTVAEDLEVQEDYVHTDDAGPAPLDNVHVNLDDVFKTDSTTFDPDTTTKSSSSSNDNHSSDDDDAWEDDLD